MPINMKKKDYLNVFKLTIMANKSKAIIFFYSPFYGSLSWVTLQAQNSVS
jgi:hypothetical protein